MRPWQFRQKTPGFGISRDFYLTVLAATAQLPKLVDVVNPTGSGGAVPGFGVPLAQSASKEDVTRPMERGIYGVASKNKETILKLMVVPKEEAGFDPGPFLRSPEAQLITEDHRARISATWTLLQMTFESHEAMVYDSLKFLQLVARRLAELTEGSISDPISRTYLLPEELFHRPPLNDKIDVRDFIRVRHRPGDGSSYTLGMQKFALAEYEMFGVSERNVALAERFLLAIAQSALLGKIAEVGDVLGSSQVPLQVAIGGIDRLNWEGIECHEIIPPSGKTVDDGLIAWAAEAVKR
jgi:hypothetical protein